VPKLARFSTPALLPDPNAGEWSARVARMFAQAVGPNLPQFYDPTKKNTPAGTPEPMISWVAFPASLRAGTPSAVERWKRADRDRGLQDEYCEWTVVRNRARKIKRVTFTTEIPEYWEHLFATDPAKVLRLYRKLVDPAVKPSDIRRADGSYKPENRWNNSRPGRLVHLVQGSNTLGAALDLVSRATVLRIKDGQPVTNQQELVRCSQLGDPLRNSDPQIASAVNVAAREGGEITLADPLGLHLGRPLTAGMITPDGADAARFWRIERGDADHTLRARFEVPASKDYVVGDIELGGRPIEFGGQIADRVQVWIKATVKKGDHKTPPRRCGEP
jgi:hypothetical protein